MELRVERDSDVDSWKEVILIYNSALKQISTKLEILNDEFQHVHRYNPIEIGRASCRERVYPVV